MVQHIARIAALSIGLGGGVTVLAAQPRPTGNPVAGRWVTDYEVHSMRDDGVTTVVKERARIALHQQGDSLLGSWQVITATPDSDGPSALLRGATRGGVARVIAEPVTSLLQKVSAFFIEHVHGVEPSFRTYEFTVSGDTLQGTQFRSSPAGDKVTTPRRFIAIREKP